MASAMRVKEPDINAWLAMMDAIVAINTPKMTNHSGMMVKNGFWSFGRIWPFWVRSQAPCPR